jgi:hypothetical protein
MLLDELPNLEILGEKLLELLLGGVPAALPTDHDAGAEAYGIDFLTHN